MKKGFTLFEVILVVAIVSIVVGFTTSLGINVYNSSVFAGTRSQMADTLVRARANAIVQKNDRSHGIYMSTSSAPHYVLFEGDDYANRAQEADEIINLPSDTYVVFSAGFMNGDEATVLFSKRTGLPNATGTITLYRQGLSRSIIINDFGFLSTP